MIAIDLGPKPGSESVVADGVKLGYIARLDVHVDQRYAVLNAGGQFDRIQETARRLQDHAFVVNTMGDDWRCYQRRCHDPDTAMSTMLEKAMCNPMMFVEHDPKTLQSTWVVRWEPR